jgi:hypothetical protein
MSEGSALFAVPRDSADTHAATALERLISGGSDRDINRINVIDFAAKTGLDEESGDL